MRVCDICGGKNGIEVLLLPRADCGYTFCVGGKEVRFDDFLENIEMDICADCRRKIANFIDGLKGVI